MEGLTVYDGTKTYSSEIEPLVTEIRRICAIKKIPFFFTCAVKNNEDETVYKTDGVLTGSFDIKLKEDHFPPILGVMNGGRVIFTTDDDEALPGELSEFLKDADMGDAEDITEESADDPADEDHFRVGDVEVVGTI